ncbi:MAG: hypothetical protein COA41_11160 [Sphingopyxis sp.]|nr:MAG: hypothetical protein COA41_11160 [Sphingopyxis sp.]
MPRTHLVVRHTTGRNDAPIAVINGFPGLNAMMTPEELLLLSRQLHQIANDARMGVRGMVRYPEEVQ